MLRWSVRRVRDGMRRGRTRADRPAQRTGDLDRKHADGGAKPHRERARGGDGPGSASSPVQRGRETPADVCSPKVAASHFEAAGCTAARRKASRRGAANGCGSTSGRPGAKLFARGGDPTLAGVARSSTGQRYRCRSALVFVSLDDDELASSTRSWDKEPQGACCNAPCGRPDGQNARTGWMMSLRMAEDPELPQHALVDPDRTPFSASSRGRSRTPTTPRLQLWFGRGWPGEHFRRPPRPPEPRRC